MATRVRSGERTVIVGQGFCQLCNCFAKSLTDFVVCGKDIQIISVLERCAVLSFFFVRQNMLCKNERFI